MMRRNERWWLPPWRTLVIWGLAIAFWIALLDDPLAYTILAGAFVYGGIWRMWLNHFGSRRLLAVESLRDAENAAAGDGIYLQLDNQQDRIIAIESMGTLMGQLMQGIITGEQYAGIIVNLITKSESRLLKSLKEQVDELGLDNTSQQETKPITATELRIEENEENQKLSRQYLKEPSAGS